MRRDRIDQFAADKSGTVTMMFGLLCVVLMAFVGAAVDYTRWSNAHRRTHDALDAALLSAARTLQTSSNSSDALAAAQKNFDENVKTRLDLVSAKVEVAIVEGGQGLEGRASGRLKTPFLGLINVGDLHVNATSRVDFGIGAGAGQGGSDLEISMMLDVTGSMCANGSGPCTTSPKMDALKMASADLVNIILKNTSANPNAARIALVPFSTRVRLGRNNDAAGEVLMKKATDLDARWTGWFKDWQGCNSSSGATSETGGTWSCSSFNASHAVNWRLSPCVTDRTGPQAFTDAAPGANAWANGMDGTRRVLSWDSADTPLATETGQTNADPTDGWNYNDGGICWDSDEKNALLPLTNDKSELLNRINGLVGYGATAGTLGTSWTWYTLSPNWSAVWPAGSQPGSYADTVPSGSNPPKLRKIAVLMSDGVYNSMRGWLDQNPVDMANNAKSVCAAMKASGVEIYTVGFDLDSLPAADRARAIDTLQTCGTDLQHFYDAINAEQLKQSFRDIAMQLAQIYIAR